MEKAFKMILSSTAFKTIPSITLIINIVIQVYFYVTPYSDDGFKIENPYKLPLLLSIIGLISLLYALSKRTLWSKIAATIIFICMSGIMFYAFNARLEYIFSSYYEEDTMNTIMTVFFGIMIVLSGISLAALWSELLPNTQKKKSSIVMPLQLLTSIFITLSVIIHIVTFIFYTYGFLNRT